MAHKSNAVQNEEERPVTYAEVNDTVLSMLEPPGAGWWALFASAILLLIVGAGSWFYQMWSGFGASGKSHPIGWGTYITNFVFWVGIAHSGTLISAVLYLFRAYFRQPIYRLAEAMTVFAVMTAGLFPIIHLGRPWYALWLFPYPNEGVVAEFSIAIALGRFRGIDLFYDFGDLLHRWSDPRYRCCP
jgi:Ni/Fe-hydrogenase subunit HybB-like protein